MKFHFQRVFKKLEADTLLYNRTIPHTGIVGAENELALAEILREFLPIRFGIETNALVIDRNGGVSKECDIVIYDQASQPKLFRKLHPVELVFAVIEVKTSMSSTDAEATMSNLESVSSLEFRPELTCYWQTRTAEEQIHHSPPGLHSFAFQTRCRSFETYADWFDPQFVNRGVELLDRAPTYPEIRLFRACALDQGVLHYESSNPLPKQLLAIQTGDNPPNTVTTQLQGSEVPVDSSKALFLFLQRLWFDLEHHSMHPGFDIRSYMDEHFSTVLEVPLAPAD